MSLLNLWRWLWGIQLALSENSKEAIDTSNERWMPVEWSNESYHLMTHKLWWAMNRKSCIFNSHMWCRITQLSKTWKILKAAWLKKTITEPLEYRCTCVLWAWKFELLTFWARIMYTNKTQITKAANGQHKGCSFHMGKKMAFFKLCSNYIPFS